MTRSCIPPKAFRRELRRAQTDAERAVWCLVRDRRLGAKFRRQHTVDRYTLDFYCPEARLAVEVDGGQHYHPAGQREDATRDALLAARGIDVIRFSDLEVLGMPEVVGEVIFEAVRRRLEGGRQG